MTEYPVPPRTSFIDLRTVVKEHGSLRQVLDRILGIESVEEPAAIEHVDDFITTLSRYFRCEERMMEIIGYPLLAVHAAEHRKILGRTSDALGDGVGHRVPLDVIAQNLKVVFRAHEQRFDMVLTDYLRNKYSL